ncbi:MAG: hypothetical protein KDC57_20015 [Saprospiraceae bacterium]|nr:hypothetical protein [Saprospiraceae bacterium]
MLSLFRRNHFFRSFLLLFYIGLLKLPLFFYPIFEDHPQGIFSGWIVQAMPSKSSQLILTIFLVFFQAAFLNQLIIRNRIMREQNLYPGVIYALLTSLIPETSGLTSALMGMTFVLFAINLHFTLYKLGEFSGSVYQSGLWMTIAGLFYFPYFLFLIFLIISQSIVKFVKPLDIPRLLLGVITPFLLLFYFYLWNNRFEDFLPDVLYRYAGFVNLDWTSDVNHYTRIILLAILIIASLFNYNNYVKKKNVQAIHKIDVLVWGTFFAVGSALLANPLGWSHMIVIYPFIACFIAMTLIQMRNILMAESIHLLLILIGFYLHYLTFV